MRRKINMWMFFPKFEMPFAREVSICAKIDTIDESILDAFKANKERSPYVVPLGGPEQFVLLRVILGGKLNTHFHIDIQKKERLSAADRKKGWTINDTLEGLSERLAFMDGLNASALTVGRFVVDINDLGGDSILPTTFLSTESGPLSMHLTAAELTIDKGPIDKLRWAADDTTLYVELFSEISVTIGPGYLSEVFDTLFAAFDALVLGGGSL